MLVSMTIMGLLAAIGLYVIGIESWFSLASLTFLGTFVPYLGAIASAIPALAVGLSISTGAFVAVAVLYAGVHAVEGYLVQPLVMRKAVDINPALLLAWGLLMGEVFGVLGLIVATPALACVQESVTFLYVERRLGRTPRKR
jgi:predicted PurR-regulated permease PerM